ncbi:Phosphatidylinositol/phosphatidylcholine transfer protein SFH1 [Diplonema papillatum]|nr:Phosphatidylinositol/phosphatidylcholine transfer protein SFH1 [Diplonema papillatum]|eukprot:gene15609-23825_t
MAAPAINGTRYADSKLWPIPARVNEDEKQVKSGPHTLSPPQIELFEKCKALLKEKRKEQGWAEGQPLLEDNMKLTDEDLALRFFVARDGKVEDAVRDALNSIEWRKKENIENIFEWCHETFPADITYKSQTNGLCGFHGLDAEGFPVWWDRPNHKGILELVDKYGMDSVMRWHFASVERGREVARWLNVDRITIVLDLQDVSATNVLFGKSGALLRAQSKADQVVYPELMRKLFIINAPWGFASAWSGMKLMFDKRMQDKITILGKRSSSNGDAFSAHIAPDQTPAEFGGTAKVDWDLCRMRPDPAPLIFKAPMYLEKVQELEKLSNIVQSAETAVRNVVEEAELVEQVVQKRMEQVDAVEIAEAADRKKLESEESVEEAEQTYRQHLEEEAEVSKPEVAN